MICTFISEFGTVTVHPLRNDDGQLAIMLTIEGPEGGDLAMMSRYLPEVKSRLKSNEFIPNLLAEPLERIMRAGIEAGCFVATGKSVTTPQGWAPIWRCD